jgi:very-short-patch-repair endonuclease
MSKYFKKNLQTTTEYVLFDLLKKNLPDYYIAPQVAMSAIVQSKFYKKRSQFRTYYVDFVICDEKAQKPLLVIELDDKSHDNENREIQDKRKNTVLHDAEIPLYRLRVGENFERTIKNEIIPILHYEKLPPEYELLDVEKVDTDNKNIFNIFDGCAGQIGKGVIIFILLALLIYMLK